ncbi:MAG: GTPase [Cyanobacteria bacterium P01_F01_bin.42]
MGSSLRTAAEALRSLPQGIGRWFQVDEAQVEDILRQVRESLPTTEVILVGKPQSGKSSVIRCLTGASVDIIGQGFRPHTRHTQTYAYPTQELPLLIFTDTVGLGDGQAAPKSVTAELMDLVRQGSMSSGDVKETNNAKIIILTVKASDFATGYISELINSIRQQYPEIPTLLAVTCLHELYSSDLDNHPAYPPGGEDLNRAWLYHNQQFEAAVDRSVRIDFTLESDGFNPVFYGAETFVDAIADLLPQAESQMIHQLLDQAEAGDSIESLYREAGRRYILPFSIMAATLAAVPLPLATMPVLTTLQVTLVSLLGRLYGQKISLSQAGGVASAVAGGFVAQAIGRELIKFVPVVGSVVAASWAGAYTWALGEGACVYFGDLMGGNKPDPKKIQATMQESFKAAQARFRNGLPGTKPRG